MSSVVCSFCAHGNPEGSKFCNECGSPLNLTLCSRCEAINNVSAEQCHQCGAPLSPTETEEQAIPPAALTEIETEEQNIPPAALTEIEQNAKSATTKDDPVPIALGERLDALHSGVVPHESQATIAEEPPFQAASLLADPPSHNDDLPLNTAHGGHAAYSGRSPARAHGLLVVVVLIALAGAVYLAFVNPTHPPGPRTVGAEENMTAPEPASSAAPARSESAESSKQPTEDSLPAASPLPSSARAFVSPATREESMSPSAGAMPSTAGSSGSSTTARGSESLGAAPSAVARPPANEAAQAVSDTAEAELSGGGTAKITNARANGVPRRMVAQGRTKEQAERDAIATQRLITRELTDSP